LITQKSHQKKAKRKHRAGIELETHHCTLFGLTLHTAIIYTAGLMYTEPHVEYPHHPDVKGLTDELHQYSTACQTQNYDEAVAVDYRDDSDDDDEDGEEAAAPIPGRPAPSKYGPSPHFKLMARRIGEFWKDHADCFPTWTKLARLVMLLQPSSAASERVFSRLMAILKRPGMNTALIDYVESSLMLVYNGKDGYDWIVEEE
jgi:hypothetical protein